MDAEPSAGLLLLLWCHASLKEPSFARFDSRSDAWTLVRTPRPRIAVTLQTLGKGKSRRTFLKSLSIAAVATHAAQQPPQPAAMGVAKKTRKFAQMKRVIGESFYGRNPSCPHANTAQDRAMPVCTSSPPSLIPTSYMAAKTSGPP